jgi:hypothetical protein
MSSHVIGFLLVARRGLPRRSGRWSLLPLAAVALRLDDVIPRHRIPPRRSGRWSLLPLAAVALRLDDVIPRHVLPPCLAETFRAKACSPVPVPALLLGCLAALIPRHGAPSSLTVVARHGFPPRCPRTASLF